MKVDSIGIEFFKHEEGFKNYVYKDSKGLDTFGVGHLLVLPQDAYLLNYTKDSPASDKLVEQVFKKDLERFENVVNSELDKRGLQVSQSQFNALTSLAFNIGESGFKGSHLNINLPNILKDRDRDLAKKLFENWKSGGILLKRRQREANLFNSGFNENKEKNKNILPLFALFGIFSITLYLTLK